MAKYVGWKYYHSVIHGLDIIESNKIPFYPKAEDEDERREILDKYFSKNITPVWDDSTSGDNLVILKISDKKELEELRLVDCSGFGVKGNSILRTQRQSALRHLNNHYPIKDFVNLNIPLEEKLFEEGYNKKVIEEPYTFTLETGNISLINYYAYMHYESDTKTPYEVGKLVLDSQDKNNKLLKKMTFNESSFEYIGADTGKFGFSFTWEQGDYEAYTLKLEKHKILLNKEEVVIHFPCCDRKKPYDMGTKYWKFRWGVNYCYCEDCDKHNSGWDKYLTYKNKVIDFDIYGIKGYYGDKVESYIYGTVIRPSRFTNEIEWK